MYQPLFSSQTLAALSQLLRNTQQAKINHHKTCKYILALTKFYWGTEGTFCLIEKHLHENRQKSWYLIITSADTLESMVQSWKLPSPLAYKQQNNREAKSKIFFHGSLQWYRYGMKLSTQRISGHTLQRPLEYTRNSAPRFPQAVQHLKQDKATEFEKKEKQRN